jgi:hypothetical protein
MSSSLTIVTAADARYFGFLQDWVLSLKDKPEARDVDLSVLDLGLTADQRAWLARYACNIAVPGWDIDFPNQHQVPPHWRANVSRPFLPRHFPGYLMYMWIDADAWVQSWDCVDLYVSAAADKRLAIACEIDRAYKRHYKAPKLFGMTHIWKCYYQAFGLATARRLGRNPAVNVGVFALHRDAPHWDVWASVLEKVLRRRQFFFAEQTALNYVVYGQKMPINLLPATCNWMPGDAVPAFDPGMRRFVHPYPPHEPIGVMHLAGADQKDKTFEVPVLGRGTVRALLTYEGLRQLRSGAAGAVEAAAVGIA